jgi:hypothetical protein
MFNYRHFIELAIKDVMCMLADLQEEEAKIEHHHKLGRLWSLAREILFKRWGLESHDQQLKPIDDMVDFLHSHDPQSTAFRYSDVPLGINNINIETVRERMTEVAELFECIEMTLEVDLDALSEHYRACGY